MDTLIGAGIIDTENTSINSDEILEIFIDWINDKAQQFIGQSLVELRGDEVIVADQINKLVDIHTIPTYSDEPSRLEELAGEFNFIRDQHILHTLQGLVEAGYSPIAFYGTGHAAALKPAFDHLYQE